MSGSMAEVRQGAETSLGLTVGTLHEYMPAFRSGGAGSDGAETCRCRELARYARNPSLRKVAFCRRELAILP